MSPISISVLAISMSMDAFAASIGRGASRSGRVRFTEALRTGAVFGVIEAVTPVIGWAIGVAASGFVEAIDHWIAFILLGCVGAHMIHAALHKEAEEKKAANGTLLALMATAVGTSLDAMAVGVSLAMLDVNIFLVAIAVGLATFILSAGGTLLGRLVGMRLGQYAEIAAGIALFGIGLKILVEHLAA